MKKRLLALSLALALCGCAPEQQSKLPDPQVDAATAPAPSPETTQEILYSTSIMADYSIFQDAKAMAYTAPVIIRAAVLSQEPGIVIGNYTTEDIARFTTKSVPGGMEAANILLSVRTPYTVKVLEVYNQDVEIDGIAVDDVMQICALGGVCCGVEVQRESPTLTANTEYIFALTRREQAKDGEPRYTLYYPKSSALPVNDFGTAAASSACRCKILSAYSSVTQFETDLRLHIAEANAKESPTLIPPKGARHVPAIPRCHAQDRRLGRGPLCLRRPADQPLCPAR